MALNFGTDLVPTTDSNYSLGNSDVKWNVYANTINGVVFNPTLILTTTNSSTSDALTVASTTFGEGQIIFLKLNAAMAGNTFATLTSGSTTTNIQIDTTTRLKGPYKAGSILGLLYHDSKLFLINPPVSI